MGENTYTFKDLSSEEPKSEKFTCILCEANSVQEGMLLIFGSKKLQRFICLTCFESLLRKTSHLVDVIETYNAY